MRFISEDPSMLEIESSGSILRIDRVADRNFLM
jgi:hypothetical protein